MFFLIDLILSLFLLCCFYHKCRILFFILLLILNIQITSLMVVGVFLPPIALSNIYYFGELGIRPFIIFCVAFVISLLVILLLSKYFSDIWVQLNKKYYLAILGYILFVPISCYYDFFHSFYIFSKETFFLKSHDYHEYKLQKYTFESVFSEFLLPPPPQTHYNLIVFFTEGMSSKVISEELTPNIYSFLYDKNVMSIKNYFNHTAATYRGLSGQLSSSFIMNGGFIGGEGLGEIGEEELSKYSKNVTTLPDILKNKNYYTAFFSPEGKKGNLSIFLKTLRFNDIFTKDDISNPQLQQTFEELSDRDNYHSLLSSLKNMQQPFFVGVYSSGTHVGFDSVNIKYEQGDNPILNKFHELDFWFGEFLDNFKRSAIAKNTIVIFTADHATFPETLYKETFNTEHPYFCDEIPLAIYHPNLKENVFIDVNGQTSLSLAPTILDMLKINTATTFLGSSIFDKTIKHPINFIYSAGISDYFFTFRGEISPLDDMLQDLVYKYQLSY